MSFEDTDNTKIRVAKSGDDFTAYHSADGITWVEFGATAGLAALNGVNLRAGILARTTSAGRASNFTAKCDYFHLNAGGYPTCLRTLADCEERGNIMRYGAAVGNLHGPFIV